MAAAGPIAELPLGGAPHAHPGVDMSQLPHHHGPGALPGSAGGSAVPCVAVGPERGSIYNGGLLYIGTSTQLLQNSTTGASLGHTATWSASPVFQEDNTHDYPLGWGGSHGSHGNGSGSGSHPDGQGGHRAMHTVPGGALGAGEVGRLPHAAQMGAPHAASGTTGATSGPLDFRPASPMNLIIRPLPSNAPTNFTDQDSHRQGAPSAPAPANTGATRTATAAVPPTGRRARPAARSRSTSPERRSAAAARQQAASVAAPPEPFTLESLAAAMAAGLKGVDVRLLKLQKSVDGVSAAVSASAENFNNMAVLAESVTAARGVTASAVAEMRASNKKNAGAAQASVAGPSLQSNMKAQVDAEKQGRNQANIVKVRLPNDASLLAHLSHLQLCARHFLIVVNSFCCMLTPEPSAYLNPALFC